MNSINNKVVGLSDDIKQIVVKMYGEKFEMIRLCKDHHSPILFSDDKPVLNITQDDFLGIFDLDSNHYFLPADQIIRLGDYCNLPLPNIIALVLKTEWEYFLAAISGYLDGTELNLKSILEDQQLIEMFIPDFNPDKGKIFKLIKGISRGSNSDKTYSHIDFFIDSLLKENIFLVENKSISRLYSNKDVDEKLLLYKVSKSEREEYVKLKELWKIKSTELDGLLLNLERNKKSNMEIENRYFKIFGKIEYEKARLKNKFEKYKLILKSLKDNPELSYRELLELANNKSIEAERERNELKKKDHQKP